MSTSKYQIIRRPVVTEKSTLQDEKNHQVVFEVDPRATKHQIKDAVEKIFKVKVVSVNTLRAKGKPLLRRGVQVAHRSNWKKAIVTLKEGDRIDFYEGV
jgi:large subunit ribosomal protein L23